MAQAERDIFAEIAERERERGLFVQVEKGMAMFRQQKEREIIALQSEAIGWNESSKSLSHAGEILAFAQRHDLDPKWLGARVSHAIGAVIRHNEPPIRIEKAQTSEEHYRVGVWLLGQDHHKDGPFLHAAKEAFTRAQQAAIREEAAHPGKVDLSRLNSLFYNFLAEEFVGVLKQIVHDNYWNNY